MGVILHEAKREYERFFNKVLPEQLHNMDYDAKVEELNRASIYTGRSILKKK
jgi:hypothetical protein